MGHPRTMAPTLVTIPFGRSYGKTRRSLDAAGGPYREEGHVGATATAAQFALRAYRDHRRG